MRGAAIIRDGELHQVFGNETHIEAEVSGQRSIGIVGRDPQSSDRVWEIAADNTTRVIADGLINSRVSAIGDVVHVVGFRPTANGLGDQVLIRSRPSMAPQEILIKAAITITATDATVITTAEGGAIVGSLFETYLVSSTSTTPVKLSGILDPEGGVRGAHTVLTASSGSSDAVFVYGEVGGVPSLSQLVTTTSILELHLLDSPPSLPSSDWFTLSTSGSPSNSCAFARIEVVGGVKQLVTFPAGVVCPSEIAGALADGTFVTRYSIWLLRADGPEHAVDNAELVLDRRLATPTVVGWTGFDELGGFTCMGSDPDRCWGVPGDANSLVFSTGTAATDNIASVWFNSDELRFYVVRSIGQGDRPRP